MKLRPSKKDKRIAQLEAREALLIASCAKLYLMTQDGKRLLLEYKRQSKLTKTQRTALKLRTNSYLRRSSSRIIQDIYPDGGEL